MREEREMRERDEREMIGRGDGEEREEREERERGREWPGDQRSHSSVCYFSPSRVRNILILSSSHLRSGGCGSSLSNLVCIALSKERRLRGEEHCRSSVFSVCLLNTFIVFRGT